MNDGRPKRGLFLPGGGTKGAFQAGALEYIIKNMDRNYDIVTGFSIGALNALGIVQQDFDIVLDMWKNAKSMTDFFGGNILFYKGLLSMKPLKKQVEERVDIDKLRESPVSFYFSTVDLQKGVLVEKDKFASPLIDWLLASCSIPGVFEPIEIDGHQYVDGGVLATKPMSPLIRAGVSEIDIVTTRPVWNRKSDQKHESIIETAQRCLELIQSEMIRIEIEHTNEMNKLIEKWGDFKEQGNIIEEIVFHFAEKRDRFPFSEYQKIDITLIEPEGSLINILEFDQKKIKHALDEGYQEAERVFSEKMKKESEQG